ncbi:hypothetical protein KY304_00575 [Candidatus Woesearchaeota archaeon]|nr:hypothetical protein [Candidatus Woesearchaeota archaeon]MBW2978589.1 hypothetical protein [Candidatus Woesearchaeota archaeon]
MAKKRLYLTSLLLIIVVFIIGVIIGHSFSNPELKEINKIIKNSELTTESYLIEQELFEDFDNNCDLSKIRLASLSSELWKLGKLLASSSAENDLGRENYNFLKRKYHLMQIKTFILYHKLKKECSIDETVVLFYYSRNDPDSLDQGNVLDRLVEDLGIRVFAIERDYADELKFLEQYYDIEMSPSLVIDYDVKKQGFTDYETLKNLMIK